MSIRLTDDDFLFLKYLFQHQFISSDLVQNYIMSNKNPNYVLQRCWRLAGNDNNKTEYVNIMQNDWCNIKMYSISTEAELILKKNDSFFKRINDVESINIFGEPVKTLDFENKRSFLKNRGDVKLHEFEHTRFLVETRLLLEYYAIASNWVSDEILKSISGHKNRAGKKTGSIPDSIFELRLNRNKTIDVALEFERTVKRPSTYKNKAKSHNKKDKIDSVIWLYTKQEIKNKIKRNLSKNRLSKTHYLLNYEQIKNLKQNKELKLTTLNNEQLEVVVG